MSAARSTPASAAGAHPAPFRYRHQGNLATIGRKAAVADLGWIKLSGFPAWVLWAAGACLVPDRLAQPASSSP